MCVTVAVAAGALWTRAQNRQMNGRTCTRALYMISKRKGDRHRHFGAAANHNKSNIFTGSTHTPRNHPQAGPLCARGSRLFCSLATRPARHGLKRPLARTLGDTKVSAGLNTVRPLRAGTLWELFL